MFEVIQSKTHEPILFWKWFFRRCPVWAEKCDICVLEYLSCWKFVFLACYNVLKLFEKKTRLAFIRWMSSIDFCKFLAFEVKLK